MNQQKKDSIIALFTTLAFALMLALLMTQCSLSMSQLEEPKRDTTPELLTEESEEEERFLEPEILRPRGEEDASNNDAPNPNPIGAPDKADVDNPRIVTPGKNPNPTPPQEKLITTNRPSPVQAQEPSATNEERQRVSSTVARGFAPRNGSEKGSNQASNGAEAGGTGISGSAVGRTFKGCPAPQISLRHKTTVKVNIIVNADGNVISAEAVGGASAEIRSACEAAARKAKWSAKPGAAESRGTITFTITPT